MFEGIIIFLLKFHLKVNCVIFFDIFDIFDIFDNNVLLFGIIAFIKFTQ